MSYTDERDRFIYQWARNGGALFGCQNVLRHATTVQRIATADCNGEDYNKASLERAQRAIRLACKQSGFSVRFGGDPRGYTVKVAFPDGSYNTWGGKGEGWGVPTR